MIFTALFACGAPPPAPIPEPACHDELPAAEPSGGSLYDLHLDLELDDGTKADLDVQRGHPVVLAMFYASCAQACPMTIAKIQGINGRLSPAAQLDLRVVMVSLDPDRDAPAALTALRGRHDLDDRWTLARVPEDHVRELSVALGVTYRRAADGEINHSTVLALLDRDGVVRARVESLGASDDALLAAADAIVAAPK